MKDILFPISGRVLTAGHIKCLEQLNKIGFVYLSLLTKKALKGYKEEIVPYDERFYIMETVAIALGGIEVVPQNSLDPSTNIRKYKCSAIASGDGWEEEELKAIKKFKLEKINLDSGCKTRSSDIINYQKRGKTRSQPLD